MVDIVTDLENVHESQRERYNKSKMEHFVGKAGIESHILFDIVFIGLVTDTGYSEDIALEFLDELHKELTLFYKNNLSFIKRQQNLKPNILDSGFLKQFNNVFEKYKMGGRSGIIQMESVNEANK